MTVRPMLATLADAPLSGAGLLYEPKYDGIRAIVEIAPKRGGADVRVWSRNANDKTSQFPAIVAALSKAAARVKAPVVLDGEIVALDAEGRPAGFQQLQGRIHLTGESDVRRLDRAQPTALILFDLLTDKGEDLCRRPLTARRIRLEALYRSLKLKDPIRISEQVTDDGRALHARAQAEGWEGLIAKDPASVYQAGRRSPAWRKIKLLQEQEFVVGGWTEPRQTRAYFGALLLGVYEGDRLVYAGHTGTGFDQKELARVWALLQRREIARSPFSGPIKTNEPAHWVKPDLVAQIKFTEWTADRKLRHPVYLGLRDDKTPHEVVRESRGARSDERRARREGREAEAGRRGAETGGRGAEAGGRGAEAGGRGAEGEKPPTRVASGFSRKIIEQLYALEDARKDGVLVLRPEGGSHDHDVPDHHLPVTNLSKIFWPAEKLTKGDLLRYYVEVSPFLLPAVADRPLVMKRFPNGVGGKAFYQQRAREERPPAGVRIEDLRDADPISEPDAKRFIGGSLTTLLYMTQIAAISQDPWFSRVQSLEDMDYAAIDLDPGDDVPFAKVLDVARWVRDELATLRVPGFPKTSGASGLHVYVPMPPGTSYESGVLFAQIVATVIATRHPRTATIERTVARRPKGTVYVDALQNILGKTLATAYSARASEFAGVSTPLTWKEVEGKLDPRDFTIRSAPSRFREVGDLWAGLRTARPADLERVFQKYGR